jgi:trigger factor
VKSEIISQEHNVVVVKTEHEASEVDKAINKVIRGFSKNINIKGFRKGHIPRKTLELFVGKNVIYRETLQRLANEALEAIVNQYELDLIADPKYKLGVIAEGEPLEIEFTFEARPEVELPDIGSLTVQKVVYKVHDSDVEEGFRQVLKANAGVEPSGEDRPIQANDIVEVQYSSGTTKDGAALELDKDKTTTLFLSNLRSDLVDAIIGHRPNEELSCDIKLEDDYPDPNMAGHTIHYELKVLNLMRRVVPEASDETVSVRSRGVCKTVDEFKSNFRRQMEDDASALAEERLRESALKALAENTRVDVPWSMIDKQYRAMRSEQDQQLRRETSQSLDDYLAANNLSVSEFDERLRKSAEATIRNTLALNALADRDEILYTSDDINEEIMEMAAARGINAQQLADSLGKNTKEFSNVAAKVRTKNAIKHLASLVSVVEYEQDYNSLYAPGPQSGETEDAGPSVQTHDEGDAEQ